MKFFSVRISTVYSFGNKNEKSVYLLRSPLDLSINNLGQEVYKSSDYISNLYCTYKDYSYIFYVYDEVGFVKQMIIQEKNQKTEFSLLNEYFIDNRFVANEKYLIYNEILYRFNFDCTGYVLQKVTQSKGKQNQISSTLSSDVIKLSPYKSSCTPIVSNNNLIFYGDTLNSEPSSLEIFICPAFNLHQINNIDQIYEVYEKFFFYQNDNFIITIIFKDYKSLIQIVDKSFKIIQDIELPKKSETNQNSRISVTPSGRFIYFIEESNRYADDGSYSNIINTYLRIFEIKHDQITNKFYLEFQFETEDLNKSFELQLYSYQYYNDFKLFVTDDMDIIFVNKYKNQIFLNSKDCSHLIKDKLGKNENGPTQFRSLSDYSIYFKITNAGISIYNSEVVYQLRIDHKNNKLLPIMKINFDLNKCSVSVNEIFCCRDPHLITIQLSCFSDTVMLTWNVDLNQEFSNFSCSQNQIKIFLAKWCRSGVLFMNNSYVNLDKGIINYYFNSDFNFNYNEDNKMGYKINCTQNILLTLNSCYCKENIFSISNYYSILENKDDVIKDNEMSIHTLKYQVYGNTILHEYALNYEPLCIILDYFEENNPEYLRTILLENSKKKSPLILAIEGKSPKNIELMFKKLARFKTDNYSSLFYDKFIDLLQMNLKAFHIYLESCFFQTTQMKSTKYLKLNSDNDPWFVTHSSCLIDRVFIDKYCSNDQKRIQEIERKKREEAEKLEAQQKLELQRQIEESKKEENKESPNDNNVKANEVQPKNESLLEESKSQEELDLEKERKKQKVLDIKAIEFDWIFDNKKRSAFIKALSNTDDLDLFSLNIIRSLIYFMWGVCWKYLMVYVFVPFAVYFSVFVVYVTYVHKNKVQNGQSYSDSYGIAQIILIIITLLFIIYQGFYEAKQIWVNKLNYFFSFWNLVDLISLLLNLTVCISDLAGLDDSRFIPLSAIAILFMYLKLFYFGRIFISTAAMVRMVIAIIYDMRYFLFVFLLACAGFGNCFFILAKNDTTNGIFTGDTYFLAFLYSYQQALGGFDVSAYEREDKHLLYFIWFFNTMILFIILLNMIVAVMGDTFDKVQETAVNNILKEIVSIMYENELLFNRNIFPNDSKYIIVIQEERAEEEVEIAWDGKLKRIKKHLEEVVNDQNKLLKELENHFDSSFRSKIELKTKELESNSDRHFASLSLRVEHIDMMISKCMKEVGSSDPSENKNLLQTLTQKLKPKE